MLWRITPTRKTTGLTRILTQHELTRKALTKSNLGEDTSSASLFRTLCVFTCFVHASGGFACDLGCVQGSGYAGDARRRLHDHALLVII